MLFKKLQLFSVLCLSTVFSVQSSADLRAPNISIVTEGTYISAFWDNVLEADGYILYYAPYPDATPIAQINYPATTTALSIQLSPGDAYYVAVRSTMGSEVSGYSNIEYFVAQSLAPEDANASEQEVIANITKNVILGSYADLQTQADALHSAVISLQFGLSQSALEEAHHAWRAARRAWEQTEAFLFGPVDSEGLDPALDSWPVNRVDLDAVLASGNNLTVGFVEGLDDTLKGFHTIEYLLFGASNNKTSNDFTAREIEYLVAATVNLKNAAQQLADAWRTIGGNYQQQLTTAGTGSVVYPSSYAVLQELVEGMSGIADEVANGKISDPYSETNTELVESQFSYNSLLDFADNIRGIENVYLGRYLQQDGPGLSDLIARSNAELDQRFRDAITQSIKEIQDIPFPFRDAISTTDGRAQIEQAIDAVNVVLTILDSEILQVLQSQ